MFIPADSISDKSTISTDICIIGTGAAGITLGLKLLNSKYSVCMIESGSLEHTKEKDPVYDFTSTKLPISTESRVRTFGGTTAAWSGRWKRFDPIDFTKREWVPHSGWPISYNDIIPYYEQAESLLNIPTYTNSNSDKSNRHKEVTGFKDTLLEDENIEPIFFTTQKKNNLHWGKSFSEDFKNSKNISVYLGAHATELYKTGSEISSVTIHPLTSSSPSSSPSVSSLRKSFTVQAKIFILATGGIENPRLLLASNIGNEHDQVGRYYMDHPKGQVGIIETFYPVDYLAYNKLLKSSAGIQVGYKLKDEPQKNYKTLNSHIFLEPVLERSISARIVRKVIHPQEAYVFAIRNYLEQTPNPENRITLSAEKDIFGYPKASIAWLLSDEDKNTISIFHTLIKDSVEKRKLGELDSVLLDTKKISGDFPITEDASHHMGATRMGTDPQTSVVDPTCKIHSTDNLYIAGSSVFPTSGYANPTSTICALAVRLADHIKTKL